MGTSRLELLGDLLPHGSEQRRAVSLKWVLTSGFLLGALAVYAEVQFAISIGMLSTSWKWRAVLAVAGILVGLMGILAAACWWRPDAAWIKRATRAAASLRLPVAPAFVVVVALAILFPWAITGPFGRFLLPFFTRLLLFWLAVVLGTWLLVGARPRWNAALVGASLVILLGAAYRVALFRADLSTSPFSLSWSEGSRYYYASLFFARRIYGLDLPWSVLHPSRYLLQSLAFLVPGAGLPFHRAWQVVLWLVTTLGSGYLLARRLSIRGWIGRGLYVLWVVLWLLEGPVYYHLLVMVILVLWGTDTQRPVRTLAVVLVASVWAGISRINWLPVPGMLAALLYFLEKRMERPNRLGYFLWPAAWVLAGTALAYASQYLYVLISGNDAQRFGSSLTSQLLWYRLLPSSTYPMGVLPAIILASLAALAILASGWWRARRRLEALRFLAIAAVLLALFAGGLIVSVKIGGGSNLHNMDAYLVALLVVVSHAALGKISLANEEQGFEPTYPLLLFALVCTPVMFALGMGRPITGYDPELAGKSLARVRATADAFQSPEASVLFISQRQLLTFDEIPGVSLVPEYETVFLMEMAMSRNQAYLDDFHQDLARHRFDLVVVDRLSTSIQDRSHNFAEENNAWVEEVSLPILCYYTMIDQLGTPPVQFYVPRPAACDE